MLLEQDVDEARVQRPAGARETEAPRRLLRLALGEEDPDTWALLPDYK
ncbi:hypothetical protein [Acidipila sp. EB88]|nr:hypothetical protein [Acidipila sp. EB88]